MDKSVTLVQTHTQHSVLADTCTHTFTYPHTTQQTDTESDAHTHTITGRRSLAHAEQEQSCLLCFASSSTEEWHFEGLGGVELRAGGSAMKSMSQDGGREKPTKVRWSGVSEGKRVWRKDLCKVSKQTISPELPGDQDRQRKWRGRKCVSLENVVSIN